MAAVNMWLDSGKLPSDLIPLYRVSLDCIIGITMTIVKGKISQIRGCQDDIGIWSWTTPEKYGNDKRIPSGAGNGPRVGFHECDMIFTILFFRKSGGPWICGRDLTMADIAWFIIAITGNNLKILASRHVSLLRFLTFGCNYLWEGLPNVCLQSYHIESKKDQLQNELCFWK